MLLAQIVVPRGGIVEMHGAYDWTDGFGLDHFHYVRIDGLVPEPSTLGLLGAGIAATTLRRKK
mgnify:FL=1